MATESVLDRFSPAVRAWFTASFPSATPAQAGGFARILSDEHTLISAPTGSGKTLAAFLAAIDRLVTLREDEPSTTRVLYVSPLRALAFDVEKNLRAPIVGIRHAAERLGIGFREPVVAMRTGDTSARDRQRMVRNPPDILITTPESLYLMLTSSARSTLARVDTIIIDEIHAIAATKRGAHLALSLERLEELTVRRPQRIGLSATQRPLEEVARFLGGYRDGAPRPVAIVDAGARKSMDIEVVVPVEDMGELGKVTRELRSGPATAAAVERRTSIWPSITPRILELVQQHRSTIIFCNARRGAERLAAQLNELASDLGLGNTEYVKAHHGSLAREQRIVIEDQLKRGQLRAIVATSSLELGIDMGAVDLVIQVESPGAVSRGMQRIGRAGHNVGEASRGKVFPKHRHDLLEVAVVAQRMLDAEIESTRYLRNPLDVLAQHIVAHVAMHPDCSVESLTAMVRRCANFAELSDEVRNNVLDLLAGRYPSEEFRDLKPRIVWDRIANTLRAREGAQRLAVTNGGTIPDRGMFGVFLPDGTRVGELDEEMVYETRPGETFVLGASTWRIEDVSFDRVVVNPAPGEPGKMPFWHGDRLGRPLELGRAVGEFLRTIRDAQTGDAAPEHALTTRHCLDPLAAKNLLQYLDEQVEATGTLPDDRTIVIERFRDEIGDWRICIHSPFGTPVHAPWAIAIERRLLERLGIPIETMWGDDGIVLRLPEAVDRIPVEELLIDPDDITDALVAAVPQTALFAARFRECAARALLLPRRRPDQRTPLWQQRQRAADLLAIAAKYPTFPILLETSRECLQDVFDVPALRDVLSQLRSRAIRLVSVDTQKASPFAQSLLFNWIAAYMYEGDAPLAERRAAALALDRDLLNDLLGSEELRELLDGEVLADIELELQQVAESRRARSLDDVHDVLRRVGDLTMDELSLRCEDNVAVWIAQLLEQRRAIEVVVAGERRFVAAEDAGRFRDALGCALPLGLPQAFTTPSDAPLQELVVRFARTHAPFVTRDVAVRFGVGVDRIAVVLAQLEAAHRVVRGEFRPFGTEREWCDTEVLRLVRRRSLAKLRKEVEPVDQRTFTRFLAEWHGVTAPMHGTEALTEALTALSGSALVASTLETDVLPLRVRGYRAAMLDDLCTSGEVVWVGAGSLGGNDGRIRLFFADQLGSLLPALEPLDVPQGDVHDQIRSALAQRGASFWGQLRAAVRGATDPELLAALWDLVWSGEVTNDSLTPLRAVLLGAQSGKSARALPATGSTRRAAARLVRPRHVRGGNVSRVGPPSAQGRWSLVSQLVEQQSSPTQALHALAMQLLERHGVVTREAVLAEHVRGGFAGVYGVLKALEERGTVRRGYFVDGLGAAQFAVPGAVDRLRACKDPEVLASEHVEGAVVLAATDPAQPYGASLEWPTSLGRPTRSAGALVLLQHGDVLGWYDVRSHHLVTFERTLEASNWAVLIEALGSLVKDGRTKSIEVRKVNGVASDDSAPATTAVAALLEQHGFVRGYRGLVLRD
ncbi:MAG: Lhr family helicase [Ilumatobacteraceae bacterium]